MLEKTKTPRSQNGGRPDLWKVKNNLMSNRPRWRASLKAKIILLVALLSLVGFGLQFIPFLYVENRMMADFEREKMEIVENFVGNTLRPVMLAGRAAELMPILAASYENFINTRYLHIVRTSGEKAFLDDKTINRVNELLGWEKFTREDMEQPEQLLSRDDPRLKEVLATRKKLVYKEKLPDGTYVTNVMIPFLNEPECQVCHGDDHKVRGVILASFSTSEHELHLVGYIFMLAGFVFAAVILISWAILFFFNRLVIKPVSSINGQISDVVENEKFGARIKVNSNDELGDLATALNYFIASVEEFRMEQTHEKDRLEKAVTQKTRELREKNIFIERDLLLARRIQQKLLPEKLPNIPGVNFHAAYIPCLHIGGDYYDVFEMPENRVGIFVVDASGHGSSAALLVSIVKALAVTMTNVSSPSQVVELINSTMAQITPDDSFVTLFYGIIDTRNGKMRYSLAGHPSPIIYNRKSGEVASLATNGGLVGVFDFDKFEDSEYLLKPGDRMLAYTDGLSEAMDGNKKQFGKERMVSIMKENRDMPTDRITGKLLVELNEYTGGATLSDDVTMVMVDYDAYDVE